MEETTIVTIAVVALNIVISALIGYGATSFRLGRFVHKVETLEKDNDVTKQELKGIRDKVVMCETTLKEREPLTKRKSPVSLTERGEKFLNDSGGKIFIDNAYNELLLKVEAENPNTAYDIQEKSKYVLETMRDDDRFAPMKDFLFKDGSSLEDLIIVMGIYLRDKILEEKKIDPRDLDKNEVPV